MSTGYAINFPGHGTFTPEGRADGIADIAAHNRTLAAEEIACWAARPARWHVYVSDLHAGAPVKTWTGELLGIITRATTYRNNFGSRTTAIRFKGTNGATYYGRFGSDWSELCRVRKAAGSAS